MRWWSVDSYSRLGCMIATIMGAAQVAVSNYGYPTCSGRAVIGPVGDTYILLCLGIGIAGVTLGAIGVHRGAKAAGIAAIVANIAIFFWPV